MKTPSPNADLEGDTGRIELYFWEKDAHAMAAIYRSENPSGRITVKPVSIRAGGVTARRFALVIHW